MTDRQTDRIAVASTVLAMRALRGVKKSKVTHVEKQKDNCSYYVICMKLIEEVAEKDLESLDLSRREVFSAMHVCI